VEAEEAVGECEGSDYTATPLLEPGRDQINKTAFRFLCCCGAQGQFEVASAEPGTGLNAQQTCTTALKTPLQFATSQLDFVSV
jgi:hypothetical protein